MKKWKKGLIAAGIAAAVLALVFAVYVQQYYRSQVDLTAVEKQELKLKIQEKNGYITILPEDEKTDTAFIFYPGGKVEYTSYLPLMELLADQGIACYLMHMPCNLAVFHVNAADQILEDQAYEHYYIGGHSLGGAMAAAYVSDRTEMYEGLVLLGAYSTKDLSNTDLKVLSVYGSEDRVLSREKYQENFDNLPESLSELVIEGGNHAYYGNYGEQKKDGTASVTREQQQQKTAEGISELIQRNE